MRAGGNTMKLRMTVKTKLHIHVTQNKTNKIIIYPCKNSNLVEIL